MKREQLEQASRLNDTLKRAERDLEAMKRFAVVGIAVAAGEGLSADPIRIERDKPCHGTGTITSISWSDDLQEVLTNALRTVFERRVSAAVDALRELGVDVHGEAS